MGWFAFQCRPENYRLVDALADGVDEIYWRTTAHQKKIQAGDSVFLWLAKGNCQKTWGLHAIAKVIAPPKIVGLKELGEYWTSESEKAPGDPHTQLKIVMRAPQGHHLHRNAIDQSNGGTLESLSKGLQGINFSIQDTDAKHLLIQWEEHLSRILASGYEPHAPNQGGQFDETARLELDAAAHDLENLSLEELASLIRSKRKSSKKTKRFFQIANRRRDAAIVCYAKKRAEFKCEIDGCGIIPFTTNGGEKYLEVHHIVPLAAQGADSIENVACVCPHHHREIHRGVHGATLTDELKLRRLGDV